MQIEKKINKTDRPTKVLNVQDYYLVMYPCLLASHTLWHCVKISILIKYSKLKVHLVAFSRACDHIPQHSSANGTCSEEGHRIW